MKVEIKTVNALYGHIADFDRKSLETLTAYKDDMAKIVYVTDIFRIYTGNQKVYIQTLQGGQGFTALQQAKT